MVCNLIKYLYVLLTSISACYKALFYQIAKLQKISALIWNEKMRFIPFVQNNLTISYRKTVVCYCLSVSKCIVTWASKKKKYGREDWALWRHIIMWLGLCQNLWWLQQERYSSYLKNNKSFRNEMCRCLKVSLMLWGLAFMVYFYFQNWDFNNMLIACDFPMAFSSPQDKKRYSIGMVSRKYFKFKLFMEFISQVSISEDASPDTQRANWQSLHHQNTYWYY